jgi:hypothetical protein
VSGLASLLFEAAPNATIDQVQNAIYESCTLEDIPVDRGNRGFPNAVRALEILTGARVGASRSGKAIASSGAKRSRAASAKSGKTKKRAKAKRAAKKKR